MKEKGITMLIVIIAIIGTIIGSQYINQDGLPPPPPPPGINPEYEKLRKDIEKLKSEKWNKTVYNGLKVTIERYGNDELISGKHIKDLTKLLNGKYILQLNDTIVNLCMYGKGFGTKKDQYSSIAGIYRTSNLTELNKELKRLKDEGFDNLIKETKKVIENYNKAISLCYNIINYTKNEVYIEHKSSNYISQLQRLKKEMYIKENKYLRTVLSECDDPLLTRLRALDNRFNKINLKTCNCQARFRQNEYYLNACQDIQRNK